MSHPRKPSACEPGIPLHSTTLRSGVLSYKVQPCGRAIADLKVSCHSGCQSPVDTLHVWEAEAVAVCLNRPVRNPDLPAPKPHLHRRHYRCLRTSSLRDRSLRRVSQESALAG